MKTKIRTRHQSQTRDSYSAQKDTQTTTTSTRYGRKYCTIPTYYMRILIIVVVVGLFTVALINHRRPKVQTGVAVAHQAVLGEQSKECSSEDLYNNPLHFRKCIRRNESSSCKPRQTEDWDKWVGDRYDQLGGKCVTPELMKNTGRTWAVSGRGSSLSSTLETRTTLNELLHDPSLNIKTFLDCPCGDWLWMQAVNLTGVQYFGADITQRTVDETTKCFERANVHFHHIDWSCAIPPPVDLVMARDVLFHLSTSVVLDILRHINQSGARYLFTTTFPNTTSNIVDNFVKDHIGYRNINLYGPPYNFPDPVAVTGMEAVKESGRHMALWKLPVPLDD